MAVGVVVERLVVIGKEVLARMGITNTDVPECRSVLSLDLREGKLQYSSPFSEDHCKNGAFS